MCNTDTADVRATVEQINRLAGLGCELIRVAVPNLAAAAALREIKSSIRLPLIADIHFDYRLALAAIDAGVDGLRLNPGNIGDGSRVARVVKQAGQRGITIRVGVNAGSLEKDLLGPKGEVTAGAMVESALRHIRLLEAEGFRDIKISLKASEIPLMLEAYEKLAGLVDYPFHIGVTEAGTLRSGIIKSAVGIGALLGRGIGDTLRVSLTAPPEREIPVAYGILQSLGLRRRGVELISCPTCGRTQIDLIRVAEEVEDRLREVDRPLKVAVMGCVVNGPGEARHADVGIAGGKGTGLLFRKGEVLRRVPEDQLVEELIKEVEQLLKE
jgi:(E)-4-hydroxy-3-methylbut-2-enyl-diphosphate synthase